GWYASACIASSTRLRSSSLTCRVPLITWETVVTETPARSATSRIVVMIHLLTVSKRLRNRLLVYHSMAREYTSIQGPTEIAYSPSRVAAAIVKILEASMSLSTWTCSSG